MTINLYRHQHKDANIRVSRQHAPSVLTKLIHHSQTLLKEDGTGIIIRIDVILSFELERGILGFGEYMKVLGPRMLVNKIKMRLLRSAKEY